MIAFSTYKQKNLFMHIFKSLFLALKLQNYSLKEHFYINFKTKQIHLSVLIYWEHGICESKFKEGISQL